jgi:glycosyltransferase involved in cell wall biosynthesis
MNLLYCITAYPPSTGGAQTHFHELVRRLGKQHACQVVCHWKENRTDWLRGVTVDAPGDSRYAVDGVAVSQVNLDAPDRKTLAFWAYAYYLTMNTSVSKIADVLSEKIDRQTGSIDLVHAGRIGREFLCWAAYKLARKRKVPFVLTPFHHPRWIGWRYRAYLELYRLADAVMTLTQAEKNILIGLGVQADRLHVLGHAPVLPVAAPKPGYFGPGGPVVLFLGQKYAYKGLDQLLQAMPLVWQQQPDTRFAFIGPETDYSRKMWKRVRDKRVIIQDRVSDEDKCAALSDSTVFCLPSHQESFGGVFTEAWSFAKPVVGRKIPAVAEIIEPGQDGELSENRRWSWRKP